MLCSILSSWLVSGCVGIADAEHEPFQGQLHIGARHEIVLGVDGPDGGVIEGSICFLI